MAEAALIASAASSVFGAAGAYQGAKAEKEQAERNAYIGRTRAIQADLTNRENLAAEMGDMRAALAANNQTMGGAGEIFRELRRVRGRERRVEFGNHTQEAADWRMQGRNALMKGRMNAIGKMFDAGQSLFSLYDRDKNRPKNG